MTSEFEPTERKGSVRPVVGSTPITTAAFTAAGTATSAVIAERDEQREGLPRAARDAQARDDERREGAEHEQHADEPELLGDHRQDEVRVGLGQVQELLAAVAEADAEAFRRVRRRRRTARAGSPRSARSARGRGTRASAAERRGERYVGRHADAAERAEAGEPPQGHAADEEQRADQRRPAPPRRRGRAGAAGARPAAPPSTQAALQQASALGAAAARARRPPPATSPTGRARPAGSDTQPRHRQPAARAVRLDPQRQRHREQRTLAAQSGSATRRHSRVAARARRRTRPQGPAPPGGAGSEAGRPPDRERRGRAVDHHDAERGEQRRSAAIPPSRMTGAAPAPGFAALGSPPRLRRVARRGRRRPPRRARAPAPAAHQRPSAEGQRVDRGPEALAALLEVAELVEARAGGRQQHDVAGARQPRGARTAFSMQETV